MAVFFNEGFPSHVIDPFSATQYILPHYEGETTNGKPLHLVKGIQINIPLKERKTLKLNYFRFMVLYFKYISMSGNLIIFKSTKNIILFKNQGLGKKKQS